MSLGVAVAGLGFMGRTHLAAYAAAHGAGFENRLVAVADRNATKRAGQLGGGGNLATGADLAAFDASQVRTYSDPEQLAEDPAVELISICTPTPTHLHLAERFLRAGKHVLVEKPVALEAGGVRRLAEVAQAAGRLCMPAHCIRYWPGWRELGLALRAGELGRVRSASFRRLAARPDWSPDFYGNPALSGGALFDLHVHDADFVRWCFGEPRAVIARGGLDHLAVLYAVESAPLVIAEGGWDRPANAPFEMAFEVVAERATWRFQLTEGGPRLWVYPADAASDAPPEARPLAPESGYDLEIRALLAAIAAGAPAPIPMEDAARTIDLLERVRTALVREA